MIVPGFKFSATAASIKKPGVLDLALMVADTPAAAAGVFTQNRVKAAPVLISKDRLRKGQAQAILVNAGNANACNGPRGLETARAVGDRDADLDKVVDALATSRGFAGGLDGGQEQRDQHGDDRDDDEQFDQGEARAPARRTDGHDGPPELSGPRSRISCLLCLARSSSPTG